MNYIASTEYLIRQLIAEQQKGICTKNINLIMDRYDKDVVVFDVKPPFQLIGLRAVKKMWLEYLPYFPANFDIETQSMSIKVCSKLAFAHWLWRLSDQGRDKSSNDACNQQFWYRSSAAYKKVENQWLITHEHVSIPVDDETSCAVFSNNLNIGGR